MASSSDSVILEAAKALGIDIPEAYREAVLVNFERLMEQAALVMAAPLPDDSPLNGEFDP